ncbi:hypothetical protein PENVUL_c010G07335 [Penicillium vulpinum]|uniref:Bacteriophage T5 Orf172 DNA-binding domain-containing protein n=2 Tax=Penicillium vulpinum TaxID=29845 RepID=A0A1V6S2Z1_9EURO|nr:hypothetical protein PENVUL_c010G07335 [Penicillium vulpinum]
MQSAIETPVNMFLYLSDLLEIAYNPISVLTCARLKDGIKPCRNKTAKANLELLKESFGDLFAILNDPDRTFHDKDGVFNAAVGQLIETCLCLQRHQQYSDDARSQWLKELYNDEKRHELRCKLQNYLFEPLNEESIISISIPPSETEFELCNPKILPSTKANLPLKVTIQLLEPLTEKDKKSGFLYLISHPREPKMFKVGHTTNRERRFGEHRRCYEECITVKSAHVPYVHRIEQLIIAEFSLVHYKLKKECSRCNTYHKEWLHASQTKVLKSFNKWVKFALAEKTPYDENGDFKTKTVPLPPPAMDFKVPTPTPKKGSRRQSDGVLSPESTPSKPELDKSDIRIIDEEVSDSSSDKPGYSREAKRSIAVSRLSDRFAAAGLK